MHRPSVNASTLMTMAILLMVMVDIGLRRGEHSRPAASTRVVQAQEFQLLGADGKMRARLATIEDRPTFALYDGEKSTPRALLGVSAAGDPVFTLLDRDGRTPRLVADLTSTVVPNSLAKTSRAALHVYDAAGKSLWSAP